MIIAGAVLLAPANLWATPVAYTAYVGNYGPRGDNPPTGYGPELEPHALLVLLPWLVAGLAAALAAVGFTYRRLYS